MKFMRWSHVISVVLVSIIALLNGSAASSQEATTMTVYYQPSSEMFPNPERGFYLQDAPLWIGEERSPQNAQDLAALRQRGISMVRWYFVLDEFREVALTDEVLGFVDDHFNLARQAGIKVIPRFAYTFPTTGEYPYQEPDAPINLVLEHIAQLTPLLQAHADVIAFMEVGFVGAWGEWHSSTNDLVNEVTGLNANSYAILETLLDALPPNRMLALRYPPYKQQWFGVDALTAQQAFDGSPQARLGAHNDCFLASETDWGTYPEDETSREALKDYLNQDNRYLPQGGETCNAAEDAQPYIGCENALAELARLRYSTLNEGYHEAVLQGWQAEGCYEEIAQRLGYRLRLLEGEFPTAITPNSLLTFSLILVNEGFASPYNPRGVEVALRSQQDGQVYPLTLQDVPDPRRWLPDDGPIELLIEANLPAELPPGDYELLLALPDPRLPTRPEYHLRLANEHIWEANSGWHRLAVLAIEPLH
jgi:hypothetical protein